VVKSLRDKGEDATLLGVVEDLLVVENQQVPGSVELSGEALEQSAKAMSSEIMEIRNEMRDILSGKDVTSAQLKLCDEQFIRAASQKLGEIEPVHSQLQASVVEMLHSTTDLSHYFGQDEQTAGPLTDLTEIVNALRKLRQAIVTSRYIVIGSQQSNKSTTAGSSSKM
jgi:hypothetical protein